MIQVEFNNSTCESKGKSSIFFFENLKHKTTAKYAAPYPQPHHNWEKLSMLQRRHQKLKLLYQLHGAQKTKMLVYKTEINCQSSVMVHNGSLSEPHQKALDQLLQRFLTNSPQVQGLKTWRIPSPSTISISAHQIVHHSWLCVDYCSIREYDNINYVNNNITIHFIRKQKKAKQAK